MFVGRKSSICSRTQNSRQCLSESEKKLSEPSASMNWKCSCCGDDSPSPRARPCCWSGGKLTWRPPPHPAPSPDISPQHTAVPGPPLPPVCSWDGEAAWASWRGCLTLSLHPPQATHPLQEHAGNNRSSLDADYSVTYCFQRVLLERFWNWTSFTLPKTAPEVSWVQSWTCLPHETLFLLVPTRPQEWSTLCCWKRIRKARWKNLHGQIQCFHYMYITTAGIYVLEILKKDHSSEETHSDRFSPYTLLCTTGLFPISSKKREGLTVDSFFGLECLF